MPKECKETRQWRMIKQRLVRLEEEDRRDPGMCFCP
jgi:hypothetical protein